MKNILSALVVLSFLIQIAKGQSEIFGSIAGQQTDFNAKYKLTSSIDEKTMTLSWSTNAPITKAVLSVYNKEQLAVRKGIDHTYPFSKPVYKYQFNLNAPAFKGYYAYWLKVFTKEGLWQEYFFKRKETSPESPLPINKEEYTTIKTNISCEKGKEKIINLLKEQDGVFDVLIDIKTGILNIKYSTDGTPYTTIIDLLNKNGYDADEKRSTEPQNNSCTESTLGEKKDRNGYTVILTNIKCMVGKKKTIASLKAFEGVSDVKIDTKTGKLLIKYSSDSTPYMKILTTINENGFVANGKKPLKGKANPCSTTID